MPTVTADDIRVLARSEEADHVLAVVDGEVMMIDAASASADQVIYTRHELIEETGAELTEMEAETIAAGLTARLSDSEPAGAEPADAEPTGAQPAEPLGTDG
jgi:hypothetical protein